MRDEWRCDPRRRTSRTDLLEFRFVNFSVVPSSSVSRRHLLALPFAILLLSSAPVTQPVAARPNILLITIDTLRADRVGAYGYKGAHTPTLDRIAA